MVQIVRDRVKQLTTTTGTGPYTMSTLVGTMKAFSAVCNVNDTFYGIVEAVDENGIPTGIWEAGLYTYSAADTITRTAIHDSSNLGLAVDWPAGDKHVSISLTATLWRSITGNGSAGVVPAPPPSPTPLGKKIAYMGDSTIVGYLNAASSGVSATAAFPEPAEGTGPTYWVNPSTGNDSNNGTSSSTPWRTLLKAASTVTTPGSTIILMDGTYIQGSVSWSASGTAGQPITVKAQNKWGAIISSTSGCSPAFSVHGSYRTFKNLWFRVDPTNSNCGSYTSANCDIRAWSSNNPSVSNPSSVTVGFVAYGIKSTSVQPTRAAAIKTNQDFSLIQNCDVSNMLESFNNKDTIIRGNTVRGQDIYGGSIMAKGGVRSNLIYNNLVFNTSGYDGAYVCIIGGHSAVSEIYDGSGAGHEAYNTVAFNNIFVDTHANRRAIAGFWGAKDCAMYNNTMVYCRLNARPAPASGGLTVSPKVKNNIMYGSGGSHLYGNTAAGLWNTSGTPVIDNNNFYNYSDAPAQTTAIAGNPNLVNLTNDFHLQSTSPDKTAGATLTFNDFEGDAVNLAFDFTNTTRSGSWSVGAYSYSTVANPTAVQTFAAAAYLTSNGYTVTNEGVNSNTMEKMVNGTDGVHPAFSTWLNGAGATYDIFIINNCINDPSDQTTTEYETNLNAVIDAIQAKGKYVILQTPNLTDFDGVVDPYRTKMKAVATAQTVPVIDVYQYSADYKTTNGISDVHTLVPDGAHPTQEYYNLIGAFCAQRFQEIASSAGGVTQPPPETSPRPYGVSDTYGALIFREEFEAATLDTTKWTPNIWYETSNATKNWDIANSCLRIWPQLDATGKWFNRTFTTDGKWSNTYGFFEARMKLCRGYGTWPAFWIFNHIGADRPEIDVMEAYGGARVYNSVATDMGTAGPECAPTNYFATVHQSESVTLGQRKMLQDGGIAIHKLSEVFHRYQCRWDSTGVQFYLEGTPVGTKISSTYFNRPMFVLLDLWFGSVSGDPNAVGAPYQPPSGSSNSVEIDYVRVWALS